MAMRTTNFVLDLFNLMTHLSSIQNGCTIGQLQKAHPWMTRGQVERGLETLCNMNFTYHEIAAHGRTGKRIFRLTETAAIHCATIARQYAEVN